MEKARNYVDCLIVGAGIAGLSAARELVAQGRSVCILEKSRGIGGRMATRRIDGESLDHGAQFFTAREEELKKVADEWCVEGIARPWFGGPDHIRYCGVSGMNALAKSFAKGLDIRREQKIERIAFESGLWTVWSGSQKFQGSRLLLTSPAPQSLALVEACRLKMDTSFLETLRTIEYDKCISLMLLLKSELKLSDSGILQMEPDEPIATVVEASVKGTTNLPGIVIQSGPTFAEENYDAPPEALARQLIDGLPKSGELEIVSKSIQKWRFAKRRPHDLDLPFSCDGSIALWHAGDGYLSPRIEGAYLSGRKAAESIVESLAGIPSSAFAEDGKSSHAG